MSRVPRVIVDPKDPLSIVEHLSRVQQVVDGKISFGSPQDPTDPQSTTIANGVAHNGILQNVEGAWVEVDVEALDTALTLTHNLDVPVVTGKPNVRWFVVGFQHDGTAQNVWDDLRTPANSTLPTVPGANAPQATLSPGNLVYYAFDGVATVESVWFSVQLPHTYKEGTDLIPHVHWTPTNANAGNVHWILNYSLANPGTAFPVTSTLTSSTAVVGGTGVAFRHSITALGTISGAGVDISAMIQCVLQRDPTHVNDTYGSDVALLEMDFHYQKDSDGSIAEFSKEPFSMSQAPISFNFTAGDTITANSIQLRCTAAGNRSVSAAHPIRATLFFVRAVR